MNLLSVRDKPEGVMTLGEMEHVYSGCAAVMVYAGKNRVFVEV
jgi:hypothetical protein